jgi:hydrogenase maturation protein HypF
VRVRTEVRVEGTVQGVGFRPFVHGLATGLGLAGLVGNDASGVFIEVEGDAGAVERFVDGLREPPPLAVIERISTRSLSPDGHRGFRIVGSDASGRPRTLVTADSATCADCLRELADPADRRHGYPFVNCTNCGPRFTIVTGVPYDRPNTTMAGFAMCAACAAEYGDPADRRFHAQPVCCPACGPRVVLLDPAGRALPGEPVEAARALLRRGGILALKGLGGYHLAATAGDESAVAALRSRKHREDKPFAVLVPDLPAARRLGAVDSAEEALLTSGRRPIVLLRRHADAPLAEAVAPGNRSIGVLLPYTPLHHLLAAEPLVLTSGNVSDEPIAYEDEDAVARLAPIADAFLLHDRPIQTRTDDSVLRVARGRPLPLRRSRGAVPSVLALPLVAHRHVLACGAELKSTFCLARGRRAWVSHHIGDLKNAETLASFQTGVAHFERLFAVAPEIVAHDLHPDYLSTTYALAREGVERVAVQHHHAHLAACLAEHGEAGPAVGAIFDGAGLGSDGTVWGGEILVGDLRGFERAGHLWPVALPGGDQAAREPWRMACAWLGAARARARDAAPAALRAAVPAPTWDAVAALARSPSSPRTTSAGRLFDAVAALAGVRTVATYEGQAAAELEAAATRCAERAAYPLPLDDGPDGLLLDARPTVLAAARDARNDVDPVRIAARFHHGLARALADACARLAERHGLDTVALGGGVWVNRLLLRLTATALETRGLRVLTPELLPPGDGGLAYGQAAIAAANDRSRP